MLAIFSSSELLDALNKVSKAMVRNKTLPILDLFLIKFDKGTAFITAASLENSLTESIVVDTYSEGDGMLVPQDVVKYLKKLEDGPIRVEFEVFYIDGAVSKSEFTIFGESDRFSFDCGKLVPSDYITIPEEISKIATIYNFRDIFRLERLIGESSVVTSNYVTINRNGTADIANSFSIIDLKLDIDYAECEKPVYICKHFFKTLKVFSKDDMAEIYLVNSNDTEIQYIIKSGKTSMCFKTVNFENFPHKRMPVTEEVLSLDLNLSDFKNAVNRLSIVGDTLLLLESVSDGIKISCRKNASKGSVKFFVKDFPSVAIKSNTIIKDLVNALSVLKELNLKIVSSKEAYIVNAIKLVDGDLEILLANL